MISAKLRYKPDNLVELIESLPRNLRGPVVETASVYLVGNEYRGLKHYPPRPGSQYIRTYNLRAGWQILGEGVKTRIFNDVEYAPFVQGDNTQAWMHVGIWKTISETADSNQAGMMRAVDQRVAREIKAHGL
jgi:hypothetical protein